MKKLHLFAVSFLILVFQTISYAEYSEIRTLLENGQADAALSSLQQLDNTDSAEINFLLASSYQQKNDLENAIKHAIQAVNKSPKTSENQMIYAETQGMLLASGEGGIFKKLGQVKRVRKAFQAAVNLDPENLRARSGLAQFYVMAPGIAGGSKKKALFQAQEIYKRDKVQAYPLLAQIYQSNKNTAKTRETLTEWSTAQPDEWNPVMATAYFEQSEKNLDIAYALYSNWLEKNPNDPAASYQLGKLAATSGQFLDEGVSSLQKYIETANSESQPKKEYAHWRLAQVYQHQDDKERARTEIEKGLALNAENKQLLELKAQL